MTTNAILETNDLTNHETQVYGTPEDFNLPAISEKIIDVEYTIEQSKELVSANDNKFPTLPTDPQALPSYIVFADKVLVAETKLLKGLTMNPKKYSYALKSTQAHAVLLLEAQLRLAENLRSIKPQRGLRNDLKRNFNNKLKSKKEIIAKDYKLSRRQARDIERLTRESIDEAIKDALESGEIPTRALALSKLPKIAKDKQGKFDFTPIIEDED